MEVLLDAHFVEAQFNSKDQKGMVARQVNEVTKEKLRGARVLSTMDKAYSLRKQAAELCLKARRSWRQRSRSKASRSW